MEWVSVKERLPELGETVFFKLDTDTGYGEYVVGFFQGAKSRFGRRYIRAVNNFYTIRDMDEDVYNVTDPDGDNEYFSSDVTHWCYPPEIPKGN